MNIIIFGTGKAAELHYKKYKGFITGEIFFIDPILTTKHEWKIYHSLDDLISNEKIYPSNTIVDVCTPHSEFNNIIKLCLIKGLNNIIVEKPFVVEKNYFDDKPQLKVIMVHNYLFSDLIIDTKNIIKKYNLNLHKIYTNFSKNRTVDSSKHRGISDKITTVFEIEIPHQIYIANSFLPKKQKKELKEMNVKDMRIGDLILENHGYGYIKLMNGNVLIEHESNLMSDSTRKQITLNFDENYSIIINFIIYGKNFNILNNGTLYLMKDNKVIEKYEYSTDDNIKLFLKFAYNIFINQNEIVFNEQKQFILDFSAEMKIYEKYLS